MPQLFMVNPPKQKSRKRRTAAQRRATAKMIAANKAKRRASATPKRKRKRTRSEQSLSKPIHRKRRKVTMARRRGRKRASSRRRTTKRRSPVTSLRRHSVYLTNPRRRRRSAARRVGVKRRRRFHRNPGGIVGQVMQGVKDAGATLVGGALARTATGFVPLPNTGLTGAAVGVGVAVGIGMLARKVVSHDTARFITAGAMQVPLKSIITTVLPQAGAFLGDYDSMGTYQLPGGGVSGYLDSVSDPSDSMGSYIEASGDNIN